MSEAAQAARSCDGVYSIGKVAPCGSVAGNRAAGAVDEDLWLFPIEGGRGQASLREGLLAGFSLGSYLLLIDDISQSSDRSARPRWPPRCLPPLTTYRLSESRSGPCWRRRKIEYNSQRHG